MNDTSREIIEENIKLHKIEARSYEGLHPEEFNWFEQAHIMRDLRRLRARIKGPCIAFDVACGTGNILFKLLGLDCEVWGVDLSEEMLAVAQNKIPVAWKARVKLFRENIDDFLRQCETRFDLVTVSSALHHFPDYAGTLRALCAFVKPGGYLYIVHEPSEYARVSDRFLRKILWQLDNALYFALTLGRTPKTEARDYHLSDYHLYHGFDETLVCRIIRKEGFSEQGFEYYASTMRLGISCWIDSRILHSRPQFCVIARKDFQA